MFFLVMLLGLQAGSALEQGFLDLERRVVSGLHEQDASALDELLAEDYVLRGRPDIDRATWIRNAVRLCWGDRSEVEEFNVREADGAVVASFVLTLYQDPTTCEPAVIRSLITDVWTRPAGEWRLTMRHSGPIGAAGEDPLAQQFLQEDPPPPRWEGTSELSFVSTGGNADIQTLGLGSQLIYRPSVWETAASGAFVRSIAEGVENARSLTAQVRQSAQISPRVDVFGRFGYRRDLFAGIEHRGAVDAGLGYLLIDGGGHRLKIDGGLGYLTEDRAVGPSLGSAILNTVKTWEWDVLDPVTLSNDAALTLPVNRADAWRLANQIALTTDINDIFSIKLSHTTSYLNQPVPGFGRTDTVLSAALVATFERQ